MFKGAIRAESAPLPRDLHTCIKQPVALGVNNWMKKPLVGHASIAL